MWWDFNSHPRRKSSSRCAVLGFLAAAVVLSCGFPWGSAPHISWTNYDYSSGLGNPAASASLLARGFVGTPFDVGVPLQNIFVRQTPDGPEIWGSAASLMVHNSAINPGTWSITDQMADYGGIGGGPMLMDDEGGFWLAAGQVYRSIDGGQSWDLILGNVPDIQCTGWGWMCLQGRTIWVAGGVGLVASIDIDSLSAQIVSYTGRGVSCVVMNDEGTLYIATPDGIYVSQDGGVSFTRFLACCQPSRLFDDGQSLWYSGCGILGRVSYDGHTTWEANLDVACFCLGKEHVYVVSDDMGTGDAYLLEVEIADPDSRRRIDLGGAVRDGSVYVDEQGTVYVGLLNRVLVSSDLVEWDEYPFGLSSVMTLAAEHGQVWAGLNGSGAARYLDAADSWQTPWSALAAVDWTTSWGVHAVHIVSDRRVLMGSNSNAVVVTDDGGATFHAVAYDTPRSIDVVAMTHRDSTCFLLAAVRAWDGATTALLYRSEDAGESWQYVSDVPLDQELHWDGPHAIVADSGRDCLWIAVTSCVYRGTADGGSLTKVPSLTMTSDMHLSASGVLYVAGDRAGLTGIHRLEGDAWSSTPTPGNLRPVVLHVDDDEGVWIGGPWGVYYAPEFGSGWLHYTKAQGLMSDNVTAISVTGTGQDKVIWVGTTIGVSRGVLVE